MKVFSKDSIMDLLIIMINNNEKNIVRYIYIYVNEESFYFRGVCICQLKRISNLSLQVPIVIMNDIWI